MNRRLIFSFLGLLLACAAAPAAAEDAATTNTPGEKIVYYFHRTARCPTCLSMEAWTGQTVEALASGKVPQKLALRAVNLDLPENQHFVEDFQITFSTVVIAEVQNGNPLRWKNLENVWNFSHDEETYKEYLESEIGPFFGVWR